ncbi:glycosyltransferase family 9 protein [Pseudokineococcus sp. 1T1Z-3]|uniref:glycosyltransferase family 9 protein n=1 Tax=Pseudokineococcus sp. 1T1Z-3 TaxID=3132745 RepID=UPI003098FA77
MGLRRARPDARLVLAGPPGPGALLHRRGVVDAVLPVEGVRSLAEDAVVSALAAHPGALAPGRCVDLAVNLHGAGPQSVRALRAVLHERGAAKAALLAHRCAAAGLADGPPWEQDVHEVDRWSRLVAAVGGASRAEDLVLPPAPGGHGPAAAAPGPSAPLVLHPGAASGARRWPVERWAEVAAAVLAEGDDVVLTGGPGESDLTTRVTAAVRDRGAGGVAGHGRLVDLAGRCDLEQLAAVVAAARALVCGDTGVAHLATALRTPSVLLFGPVSPRSWGPAVDVDLHPVLWPAPTAGYRGDPHGDAVDPVLARTTSADVLAALGALAPRPGR